MSVRTLYTYLDKGLFSARTSILSAKWDSDQENAMIRRFQTVLSSATGFTVISVA